MNRRIYYLLGGGLLLAFAGFSLASFKQTLTPYVSYEQARTMGRSRTVQVAGALERDSTSYDAAQEALLFTLQEPDSAERLRVRYHGLKPANFEDAVSIVAIGRFDADSGELRADKLLVKCPSKYQGLEDAETRSYS